MVNKTLSKQSLANLSSLGKIVKEKSDATKAFQTLPIDRIYSKAQPRTIFERIDELADNMKAIGQQQPIVVSPDGTGRYVIEQGERRWRAAKLAKLLTLDCIVTKPEADDPKRLIRQLSENIQREDMTLWDLSNSIALLVSKGLTIREIATQLGKKEPYISVLNSIHTLPDELAVLVKNQHVADPLAVRKLQKRFEEDPDAVRAQIQAWSDAHEASHSESAFVITRAQVQAFIKQSEKPNQAPVVTPDATASMTVDTTTDALEVSAPHDDQVIDNSNDSNIETKETLHQPQKPNELTLPAGCSSVSLSKVRMDVLWNSNEAYITPGVIAPDGKVCITLKATKEIYLADVSSIVFVGVSKI